MAQLLQPSLAFCFSLQPMTAYRPVLMKREISVLDGTPSLAASWNKMLMRAAIVVQVLQDLFYVLLHVLFYLWSLLYTTGRHRSHSAQSLISGQWSAAPIILIYRPAGMRQACRIGTFWVVGSPNTTRLIRRQKLHINSVQTKMQSPYSVQIIRLSLT